MKDYHKNHINIECVKSNKHRHFEHIRLEDYSKPLTIAVFPSQSWELEPAAFICEHSGSRSSLNITLV